MKVRIIGVTTTGLTTMVVTTKKVFWMPNDGPTFDPGLIGQCLMYSESYLRKCSRNGICPMCKEKHAIAKLLEEDIRDYPDETVTFWTEWARCEKTGRIWMNSIRRSTEPKPHEETE